MRGNLPCLSDENILQLRWASGIPIGHPDDVNPYNWKGENRLGKILTLVREVSARCTTSLDLLPPFCIPESSVTIALLALLRFNCNSLSHTSLFRI